LQFVIAGKGAASAWLMSRRKRNLFPRGIGVIAHVSALREFTDHVDYRRFLRHKFFR
jgi:hypothetical protein